jgi:polar amino acid transport system substrate-binding protein
VLGECQDRRGKLLRIAAVLVATCALALSGCASGTDSGGGQPTAAAGDKVDEIANTVPEEIRSTGKLVVGVNIPYAPNEFKDPSGKIVGFDVDLMNAIAATLGLTAEYRESDFAKIIPSIQGGTYNVGMSSFTDTKEREASVDFVTYFNAGILWAQRPGTPVDPNNACGKKVAVQATTTEELEELPAAVVLGQADAMSADSPVTSYAIKQSNGKLEAAGEIADAAPYGWPVQKGSPLAESLKQALEHLIENGKYEEIAKQWGVEAGMIDKPVINGAVS